MAKARRLLTDQLQRIDAVIELCDARLPLSSRNPDLDPLVGNKPRVLLLNKSDLANPAQTKAWQAYFQDQGLDCMAIEMGRKKQSILNAIVKLTEERVARSLKKGIHRSARAMVLGVPNVGKSSLLNCLLGEERSLVHHEAGTTRDTVDTLFEYEGQRVRLVDTAGLRKRSKVDEDVEYYSSLRSLQALQRAQVGVLVLDATETITSQDQRIAGEIQKAGLASVIVVNKWDKLPKATLAQAKQKLIQSIAAELDFMSYSPVIYVSAKTGFETHDILGAALDVAEQWKRRIETSTLNLVVREAVALKPPPSYKGQQLKVLYVSQPKNCPPTVVFKVNSPKLLHFSYRRYLENQLRAAFGLVGTPLIMRFES